MLLLIVFMWTKYGLECINFLIYIRHCVLDTVYKSYYNTLNMNYRVTHGNLTSFEWVVLRIAPKKNKLCQCVVSTRWCHSAHCKRVNDHCSKHVSRAPHFPFRRRAVAPSLTQSFNMWFFFGGYLKSRVYTHKPRTLNDLKEAIRQEIRPIDHQLLARVMDDFKKRLENYIQEDGRHLTNIIFKT